MEKKRIKFEASRSSGSVSGIIIIPENIKALFIFAHGAGAGMEHPFMNKMSGYLAEVGIGTFRFNFPYIEKKTKRPDPAPILTETIKSAFKTAEKYAENIPIFAGGKSMGGRMTSNAASKNFLEGIRGIIFLGFPLHPPGKPSVERAEHLFNVDIPMLFLQGTRDKLADLDLLNPIIKKLEEKVSIFIVDGADHSFHMLKSSGKSDEEVFKELANETKKWIEKVLK